MKSTTVVFLLFSITMTSAQQDSGYKNLLSTALFKVETNSQTLYKKLWPKNFIGLEYERTFNRWSWSTSIEHSNTEIDENAYTWPDGFYGTGHLKEYNFFSGISYIFIEKAKGVFKIQVFVGTDFYYNHVKYSGDFGSGFTGRGIRLNDRYNSFGIRQRVGLHFYPSPRIRTSLTTSTRSGYSWKKGIGQNNALKIREESITFPELKIGFLF